MPVDRSGRVYVVGSVPLLHPEAQTVEEMLEGWRNQQLCRNLDHETIAGADPDRGAVRGGDQRVPVDVDAGNG